MAALPALLARRLLDLAFPPACPACAAPEPEGLFCPACREAMEPLSGPACPICGKPHSAAPEPCPACRAAPPAFDRARALARHGGPLALVLRGFKYRRQWSQGAAAARWLAAETPAAWLAEVDLAAPVPLHALRLLRRGFNQALVLARPLARAHGLDLAPRLLVRRRHTRPQVGLNPEERRSNVAGAFDLGPGAAELVSGRRVLLVDDVFTTGATVAECARVLKAAGAARVEVLTPVRALGTHPNQTSPGREA